MTKTKEETKTVETTETETHPCACSLVRVDIPQEPGTRFDVQSLPRKHRRYMTDPVGDDAGWVYLETMCTQDTHKTFAPGHDARFAGLMQTAIALNASATWLADGVAVSSDPMTLVDRVSPNLSEKVAAAIGREPKERKPRKASTKGKGKEVTAKVGRWERTGYVDGEGTFVYTDSKGKTQRAFDGHYTLVA